MVNTLNKKKGRIDVNGKTNYNERSESLAVFFSVGCSPELQQVSAIVAVVVRISSQGSRVSDEAVWKPRTPAH